VGRGFVCLWLESGYASDGSNAAKKTQGRRHEYLKSSFIIGCVVIGSGGDDVHSGAGAR
jgi:hypothetical protein